MKKILIPVICLLLCACAGNEDKNKTGKEKQKDIPATENAAQDKVIKEWLAGKEWKAENENAPMSFLRIYSMDSCSFTAPRRYSWDFKNGRFIMLAEWPLTRVSDTSFTLFVEPTQKTYTFNFVRTL